MADIIIEILLLHNNRKTSEGRGNNFSHVPVKLSIVFNNHF